MQHLSKWHGFNRNHWHRLTEIAIWDKSLLKDTIYWTFGVGFIQFINVNDATSKEHYFKKILIDNFKLIVILQFLTNLYFFNIVLEIIIIPVLLIFTMMSAYSENKEEYKQVKKISDTLLAIYGFAVLIFSIYHAIKDFESINNMDSIKSFLLSPVLTILYIPFLFFMALIMAYESFIKSKKWILKDNKKVYRFLKRNVYFRCGFSLKRLRKLTKKLHVYSSITKAEVKKDLKIILNE